VFAESQSGRKVLWLQIHPLFILLSTTGHENGQILIWDAAVDQLHPLVKVGEVGSPVKAIGVHNEYCLMSTAHASGEVCIFLRPSEEMEWAAAPGTPHLGTLRPRKVRQR
jgi:hypothetical protein